MDEDNIILEEQPYVVTDVPPDVDDKGIYAIMVMDVLSVLFMIIVYNSTMNSIIKCEDIMDLLTVNPINIILNLLNFIMIIIKFILLIKDAIALYKIKKLGVKLILYAILFKPGYVWVRAKTLDRDMKIYYAYAAILGALIIWFLVDFYITINQLTDKLVGIIDSGSFQYDPYQSIIPEE